MSTEPGPPPESFGRPAETESGRADPTARFERRPLWLLFLLVVMSCGLYIFVWMWSAARSSKQRSGSGFHPIWWCLGLMVPIIGAVTLGYLGSASQGAASHHGPRVPWLGGIAGSWFFVVCVAGGYLSMTLVPILMLLAVPFLLVQYQMNREWRGGSRAVRSPSVLGSRIAAGISLAIGVPLVTVMAVWNDRPAILSMLETRLPANEPVLSLDEDYSLTTPNGSWVQVAPGSNGDADAHLELQRFAASDFVVVYRSDGTSSLDVLVDARIDLLNRVARVTSVEEKRSFADTSQGHPIPVSAATYTLRSMGLPLTMYVKVVVTPQRTYEVVGSVSSPKYSREVHDLVNSFVATETGAL